MSSSSASSAALKFRQTFSFPVKASHNWFPGHMNRGLKDMQRSLKEADLVVEVHDARIPFSGRNIHFRTHIAGHLPHILVLNKKDLVSQRDQRTIRDAIKEREPHLSEVLFTNCKISSCSGLQKVREKTTYDYVI